MLSKTVRRPSPALIVAIVALVAALAGSAIALPGKNSVKKNDIAKNAVVSKAIKNNKVTGADVKESSLGQVPSAAAADSAGSLVGHQRKGLTRVAATEGADFDAARQAAPEVSLFTAGPFTVYAKCFTNAGGPTTYAYTYVKTTENGSLLETDADTLDGDGTDEFLNSGTDEVEREGTNQSSGSDSANINFMHSSEISAVAPSGTAFEARVAVGAKNGDPGGGDGAYGPGDACVFFGDLMEFTG